MGRYPKPVREQAMRALAVKHDPAVMLTAYDQLKPSERMFVNVYVATDNPMKAIMAATPALESNPRLAQVRAFDMLKRPLVQAAIAQKINTLAERYDIQAAAIYKEVAKIAKSDIRDYMVIGTNGMPKLDLTETSDEAWGAISGFEVVAGIGVIPKMHDKQRALEMAIKLQGLYAPVGVNLNVSGGLTVNTEPVKENMTAEDAAEYYQQSLEAE